MCYMSGHVIVVGHVMVVGHMMMVGHSTMDAHLMVVDGDLQEQQRAEP